MADISITVDSKRQAKTGATNVIRELDRIEDKAKQVQAALAKLDVGEAIRKNLSDKVAVGITATLKPGAIRASMNKIQTHVNALAKTKPITIRAVLKLDKRTVGKSLLEAAMAGSLSGETGLPKGMEMSRGPGWFAESPESARKRAAFEKAQGEYYEQQEKLRLAQAREFERSKQQMRKDNLDELNRANAANKRIDEKVTNPKTLANAKLMASSEGITRKIEDATDPKQIKKLKDLRREYQLLDDVVNKGAKTNKYHTPTGAINYNAVNKQIDGLDRRYKSLGSTTDKVSKSQSILNTKFGKLTIIMSGLAASIFVFQEVIRLLRGVYDNGMQATDAMAQMAGTVGYSAGEAREVWKQLEKQTEGTVFTTKDASKAYTELRKAGLNNADAMDKVNRTLRIARNENVDLAKAAALAKNDIFGLSEGLLQTDKLLSQSANDAIKRFTKSLDDMLNAMYFETEPDLIDFFDKLRKNIVENKDEYIQALQDISTAIMGLLSSIVWLIEKGAKFNNWWKENIDPILSSRNAQPWITGPWTQWVGAEYQPKNGFKGKIPDPNDKSSWMGSKLGDGSGVYTDQKEISSAMAQVFSELGVMMPQYRKVLEDQINETVRMVARYDGKLAETLKNALGIKLELKELAPWIQGQKEIFRITSQMSDKYYEVRKEMIKNDALYGKGKGMSFEERKLYIADQNRKLDAERRKPRVTAAQEIFDSTGFMSEELEAQKRREALYAREQRIRGGASKTYANIMYQADVRQIEIDKTDKAFEAQEKLFEATGKWTMAYVEMSRTRTNAVIDTLQKTGKLTEDEATKLKAIYDRQLGDKLMQPLLDTYRNVYQTTEKMTDAHYKLENEMLESHMIELREKYGAGYDAILKEYEEHQRKLIDIQKLESNEDVQSGFKAGQKRVSMQNETVSKAVSDSWVEANNKITDAFENGFFAMMEFRFDELQDIGLSVLKALQRGVNEVLYELVKVGARSLVGSFSGGGNAFAALNNGGSARAGGGWLMEPIVGTGLHTGSTYTLAEKGPELVSNTSQVRGGGAMAGGGGSLTISVPINMSGGGSKEMAVKLQRSVEATVRQVVREEMR